MVLLCQTDAYRLIGYQPIDTIGYSLPHVDEEPQNGD